MKKRDPIIRCYTCNELDHIAKNWMNIERIKDDKKEKVDKIKKEMNLKWIKKSLEHSKKNNDELCSMYTSKLGAISISK